MSKHVLLDDVMEVDGKHVHFQLSTGPLPAALRALVRRALRNRTKRCGQGPFLLEVVKEDGDTQQTER